MAIRNACIFFLITFASKRIFCEALEVVIRGKLPSRQYATAAVYDGDNFVYILGGVAHSWFDGEDLDQVLRYDLSTNEIENIGRFPIPVTFGAAAKDQFGNIFYFGGSASDLLKRIWKFNKENPNPKMVSNLPAATTLLSAASDGKDSIYLVGGIQNNQTMPQDILKFDTTTGNVEVVAQLPVGRISPSSVHLNGSVYILGGRTEQDTATKDIFRYTTAGDEVEHLQAQLDARSFGATSLAVGDIIYVVGGSPGTGQSQHISKFHTSSQVVERLRVKNFPTILKHSSCVYVPKLNRIYIFGGFNVEQELTDEILSVDL